MTKIKKNPVALIAAFFAFGAIATSIVLQQLWLAVITLTITAAVIFFVTYRIREQKRDESVRKAIREGMNATPGHGYGFVRNSKGELVSFLRHMQEEGCSALVIQQPINRIANNKSPCC